MGRAYPSRAVRTSGPKKTTAKLLYRCTGCGSEINRTINMPRGKSYASAISYQSVHPSHCPHCRETHPNTCACTGCQAERTRAL